MSLQGGEESGGAPLEHHGLNGVWPRINLDRNSADGEVVRSALCCRVHDDHDHFPVSVHEGRGEQHAAARGREDPSRTGTNELREVAYIVVRIGVDKRAGTRVGMDRCKAEISHVVNFCFARSEEHTSELQSLAYLVCRLLLEKKKTNACGWSACALDFTYP